MQLNSDHACNVWATPILVTDVNDNTCQRTGTYLKLRISVRLCKKKKGLWYLFFFQRNSYHQLQRLSSQTCHLISKKKNNIGFFFLRDLCICVWINFWREREKNNNYSILIYIYVECTVSCRSTILMTHKQMNQTTVVYYHFISQGIYHPVFVFVFF